MPNVSYHTTPAELRAKAQELVRRAPTCTVEVLDGLYHEFTVACAHLDPDQSADTFKRMEILLLSVRYVYLAHEQEKLNPSPRVAVVSVEPHVHLLTDITIVPPDVQREMLQILQDPVI